MRVVRSVALCLVVAFLPVVARAQDKPLGDRLVNQLDALFGVHPGIRANHAKGIVFEGTFTPTPGAETLSSASFLKGAATPVMIRFSNSGGVPGAPDTDPSTGGVRGMAIKLRLACRENFC